MQEKKNKKPITHLFVDIGGVLLTNGWDHQARQRAAAHFDLPFAEMENRHHLTFEVYERGYFTLEEYLSLVVFYEKRSFTEAQFRQFMFDQSQSYPEMIALIAELKKRYGLKIALNVSLAAPGQVLYIENTPLFVQMAEKLGISSILHTDIASTRKSLAAFGLES